MGYRRIPIEEQQWLLDEWDRITEAEKSGKLTWDEVTQSRSFKRRVSKLADNGWVATSTWDSVSEGLNPKGWRAKKTTATAWMDIKFTPRSHMPATCLVCDSVITVGTPKYWIRSFRRNKTLNKWFRSERSLHVECFLDYLADYRDAKMAVQEELNLARKSPPLKSPGRNGRIQSLSPDDHERRMKLVNKARKYIYRCRRNPTLAMLNSLVKWCGELNELGGVPYGWEEEIMEFAKRFLQPGESVPPEPEPEPPIGRRFSGAK